MKLSPKIIIIIVSVIANIILVSILFIQKDDKNIILNNIEHVKDDLYDLSDHIIDGNRDMEMSYQETLDEVERISHNAGYVTNELYGKNIVTISSGPVVYYTEINETNYNDVIRALEQANHYINKQMERERHYRVDTVVYITNNVESIITNVHTIENDVKSLGEKTWTFSVGLQASYIGFNEQTGLEYNVGIHSLVFFKNTIYFGASIGLNRSHIYGPSVGLMAGYKFQ